MDKLHIQPLLHFQNNNENYILNSINNQIFRVSPELASCLKENDLESLSDNSIVEALKKSFVIADDQKLNDIYDILIKHNKFMPSAMNLLICQDCNLRCGYCYGDGGQYKNKGYMSFEVASKAVDIIATNAQATNKKASLNFFGGEPLLNFKLMKQVVAYANEKGYDIDYSITTNGTLINKEIEQFLIENNITTQISIDGDEYTQNTNRPYANKWGSYKDVITATAHLRELGLLGARATVTTDNPNYGADMLHLISIGFRDVTWGCAIETLTFQSLDKMLITYQNLCDEYYNLVVQGKYLLAKKLGNITRYLKRLHTVTIRDRTCGAGHTLMAVDIDGKMYPCHRFVSNGEYALGSVFQEHLNQINEHKFYKKFGIRNHEKCLSCVARNFCCGGCINMNYYLTSSVLGCPDITCHQIIEEMKITAELYTSLSKEQLSIILASKTKQEDLC